MIDWRADRIGTALRGENPTVMSELAAGFAVIGDVQFLPGYSLLLAKRPEARSLAELPRSERLRYLADVDLLATAVENACRSLDSGFRRMNIEILGNTDAFVHAHLWPRYEWEPIEHRRHAVWTYPADRWSAPEFALGQQHETLRETIEREIATEIGVR